MKCGKGEFKMKRILLAAAALSVAATAAHAAPRFGSMSASSQSAPTSVANDSDKLVGWVSHWIATVSKAKATGAPPKTKDRPAKGQSLCPDQKKSEGSEDQVPRAGLQAGPEPVYLAF